MISIGVFFTGERRIEVRPVEVGDPGPGQVLIKTSKSLISAGTECICFTRAFAPGTHWDRWVRYPFPAGYSAAGRVLAVGQGVAHLRPGDRVAGGGGHQARSLLPTSAVFPVPGGVSDEEATWATLAYITQHGFRKADLRLGETAAVLGLGQLGQLVVQYARAAGAGEVIAIDPAAARVEIAKVHGATHGLALGADDAADAVAEITRGRGADVVFDMTGHAAVFAAATRLLRKHGRLVLVGDTGTPSEQRLTSEVIRKDLRIVAAHAGNAPDLPHDEAPWSKAAMVELFFPLLERGQMRVADLVTHRYAPAQAAEAYELLTHRRDEAMGVVFDFETR